MADSTTDYVAAQAVIEKVVRDFRPELLELHGHIIPSLKSDTTPVTDADKKLETLLRAALTGFDSSIGLEGEELGKQGNPDKFWLIDPIDGTESFVRGLPFVRNMVTLIENGEPVFAFVYKPIQDELYIAIKGQGAYKDGQKLQMSERPLSRAWIELSAPLSKPEAWPMISAVRQVINGFRVYGDFTFIAEGKVEGQLVYGSGGGPWDYAPRALLVSESGGKVANIGSQTYDYRNSDVLMASSLIFDDLMAIINSKIASN